MAGDLHVLGIRHHGPGSARAVQTALDEIRPELVLIEGPSELDGVAQLAASAAMRPPVAGLVYAVDDPSQASFYPMAVFSPEWVALRWALAAGAEVGFADLPATNHLADQEAGNEPDEETSIDATEDRLDTGEPSDPTGAHHGTELPGAIGPPLDPITTMATAAGYDDPERWWEDAVEHRLDGDSATERFAAIAAAFGHLREAGPEPDLTTLRREAAMRRRLRAGIKNHQRVVFVCGAYHVPAVQRPAWPTARSDNDLLRGLAKVRVEATWAPWTSGRLALDSGYGAGVTAPGWYHHLFTTPVDVTARWLVQVAGTLRLDGHDVSSASVVEATRMADTLAAVRGRSLAGLTEMDDATVAVLCAGSELPLRLVGRELTIGHQLGSVPDETPSVPLARDLARLQKRLRFKPSAQQKTVVLDLRNDTHLARSHLLHRLAILGVDWGAPTDAGRSTGTFKEAWLVEWRPELSVDLIEASLHGTTVEGAAAAKVSADAAASDDLGELARLVEVTLTADLGNALDAVLAALDATAAHQHDALMLCTTIEPLARTRRYGDVRGTDVSAVDRLLRVLATRAAVGLPTACASLDDDGAARCRAAIESASTGIAILGDPDLQAGWHQALERVAARDSVHGSVAGRVNRLLLDAGRMASAEAGRRLSRILSLAADPSRAAAWLDGFLAGDAMLLIHDPALLTVIDGWLSGVADDVFDDLLPLLRRTFSRYEKPERRQIGEQLRRSATDPATASGHDLDPTRAAAAMATVARMLGLEPLGAEPNHSEEER